MWKVFLKNCIPYTMMPPKYYPDKQPDLAPSPTGVQKKTKSKPIPQCFKHPIEVGILKWDYVFMAWSSSKCSCRHSNDKNFTFIYHTLDHLVRSSVVFRVVLRYLHRLGTFGRHDVHLKGTTFPSLQPDYFLLKGIVYFLAQPAWRVFLPTHPCTRFSHYSSLATDGWRLGVQRQTPKEWQWRQATRTKRLARDWPD